jgi:hypothetical protein
MELTLPTIDERLLHALEARGFETHVVDNVDGACDYVLSLLPDGALVSHGGSTTLEQIGLIDSLAVSDRLRYGNAEWVAENDAALRLEIRKRNTAFADVYMGSVQAVARTGQVVGCDAMGGRQVGYIWGPPRVIWVVGANKIVDDLDAAIRRVYQVAFPLEDVRVREAGEAPGSGVNKLVFYEREPIAGRTAIVLVNHQLGF